MDLATGLSDFDIIVELLNKPQDKESIMQIITNAQIALSGMTHTELMLTGIFACLLVQTLFQIAGKVINTSRGAMLEHQASWGSTSKGMSPLPMRSKSDQ